MSLFYGNLPQKTKQGNVSCYLPFLIIDDILFILVLKFLYWLLNHCVQSSKSIFLIKMLYIFLIFSVKKTRMIDMDAGCLSVYGIQESRFRISDLFGKSLTWHAK